MPFDDNLNNIMTQSVQQCLVSGTPFGWVSDYYNTMLYQIDINIETGVKGGEFPTILNTPITKTYQ